MAGHELFRARSNNIARSPISRARCMTKNALRHHRSDARPHPAGDRWQKERALMSKLDDPCSSGGNGRGCHADPLPTAQAMMLESDGFVGTPRLDFEAWRTFLRSSCGNHPDVIDPSAFAGWVRPLSVCGLAAAALKIECGSTAVDFGRDPYRSERTQHDARLAGADYHYAVFQVAGRSTLTQNEEVAQLAVGDVALLDAARPAACSAGDAQWLRVQLPRQSLISHLGCEPQGGSCARGGMPAAQSALRPCSGCRQRRRTGVLSGRFLHAAGGL